MASKYNLSEMKVGDVKSFSLAIYDKIRLSAHFTGKRYGWKFKTKKYPKTVKVFRTE